MTENTIDTLMDRMDQDPLLNTPKDIDWLVAYYRKQRAKQVEGGPRPKRESGPKLDIGAVMGGLLGEAPAKPTMKRRV